MSIRIKIQTPKERNKVNNDKYCTCVQNRKLVVIYYIIPNNPELLS